MLSGPVNLFTAKFGFFFLFYTHKILEMNLKVPEQRSSANGAEHFPGSGAGGHQGCK